MLLFGFLGKYSAVDDYESAGNGLTFNVHPLSHNDRIYPAKYEHNVNGAAIPNPDTKQLTGNQTFVAFDGNIQGDTREQLSNLSRGYQYLVNPGLQRLRFSFWGDRVRQYASGVRSDFFNLNSWQNLKTLNCGYIGTVLGSPTLFKGLKGKAKNLETFSAIPIFTVQFTQFTTIEHRFPPTLKYLFIRANGVASVVVDRLAECTNLVKCFLGDFQGAGSASPYPTYDGSLNGSMNIPGTVDLSHIQTLEELGLANSSFTSLSLHAGAVFKIFQVSNTPSVDATQLRTALNLALSSPNLVKFFAYLNSLTWSRAIGNADISNVLVDFSIYGNIITGNVTISTAKAAFTGTFRVGLNTQNITTAASKNSMQVVDITGLTNALTIDLSNSRIEDLQLPVNTVIQNLYLGGNKLDIATNVNLINQIRAMTNLRNLWLSAGVIGGASRPIAADIENGQNSTNGFGANVSFSTLTLLTTLVANKCKLSGTLTIPSSLTQLFAIDNDIAAIGAGTISNLVVMELAGNTNLVFDFTRLPNLNRLVAPGSGFIAVDLSGRTSTNMWGGSGSGLEIFDVSNCPNLVTLTFPTAMNRAVFAGFSNNSYAMRLHDCPLLTSIPNHENINFSGGGPTRPFYAYNCALNIEFKLGVNSFLSNEFQIQNNGMSQANVDASINNYYTNRTKFGYAGGSLNIAGSNSTPSGTLQAPTGYKTASITGITKAATAVVTVAAIGTLANNDQVVINGVSGMTQINSQLYTIKNIVGNTFELWNAAGTTPIDSTAYSTYTSGGTSRVEGTPASAKEQVYVLTNVYNKTITIS